MKKILIAVSILLLTVGMAHAVPKDNCGCGLGTMVFQNQDGLFSQVLAVSTNGLFGNQTFGISSGTLGCDRPQDLARNEQVNRFVAANMDNLAIDIATGQGESLNTLAELIQVPREKRPVLYSALQNEFDTIYPDPQVTHQHVIEQISVIVAKI